jgi:hypothetical protein
MSVEERLAVLEEKVELLSKRIEPPSQEDWTERVIGSFANCPEFDEVLRLGREFRQRQNRIPTPEDVEDEAEDRR